MAAKPGGMQGFVRGKEAGGQEQRAVNAVRTDDLRVSTNRNGMTANSGQARARPSPAVHPHVKYEGSQPSQSNGKKPFWDTGDSSIGDTSDTPALHEIEAIQDQLAGHDANAVVNDRPRDQSEAPSSKDDFEGNEDVEDDGEHGVTEAEDYDPQYGHLSSKQLEILRTIESEGYSVRGTVSFPYVKGDSYPSTTSGPSSMNGADQSRPVQTMPGYYPPSQALPAGGHNTQQQYRQPGGIPERSSHGKAQPARTLEQRQPYRVSPANGQLSRAAEPLRQPARQEMQNGFAFAAGPGTKTSNAQQYPNQDALELDFEAQRQTSAVEDERQIHPPQSEHNHRQPHRVNPAKARQEEAKTAIRPASRVTFEPQQAGYTPAGRPQPQTVQDDAQMSDSGISDEQKKPFEKETSPETDFDVAELFDKDFSELKAQPFDVDPRGDANGFPGIASDDAVEKQVATAEAFQPKDQHAFFSSLPIDEWEQAGDWFLDRFGETLAKLKHLRQEKRKAARAFEKEIEGRHVAVTKKRKLTESALNNMKKSGNMVLASTPKKARTTG